MLLGGARTVTAAGPTATFVNPGIATDFSTVLVDPIDLSDPSTMSFSLKPPAELTACGNTAITLTSTDRGRTYQYQNAGVTITASQTTTDPLLKGASMSGTFQDTRAAGSPCPTRNLTWATVSTRYTLTNPIVGADYTGAGSTTSAFRTIGNAPGGGFGAAAIAGLQLTFKKDACTYAASLKANIPVGLAFGDFQLRETSATTPTTQTMVYGVFQGTRPTGIFVQTQGASSTCAPVITVWTSDTPAFGSPPTFSAAGQAQAIFKGGDTDDLENAAKAVGATGLWMQDAQGAYQLLAVGAPRFLKSAFAESLKVGRPSPLPGGATAAPGSYIFVGPTAVTLVR